MEKPGEKEKGGLKLNALQRAQTNRMQIESLLHLGAEYVYGDDEPGDKTAHLANLLETIIPLIDHLRENLDELEMHGVPKG
jgi:hypothetical protein